MAVVGLVPAAGLGSRFAAAAPDAPPKMLISVDGVPMVRRTVTTLLDGGASRCVVVVSAETEAPVRDALAGLPVQCVVNPDPSRGMFSSVQCAVAATGPDDLCVLLPGDMPFVKGPTVAALLAEAERRGLTVSASSAGSIGHPVVLSARLRERVLQAPDNAILSQMLSRDTSICVDVADPGVHRDVDRPEDLAGGVSRQQLKILVAALNAAANGVLITDREGSIEWVNQAVLELTGYSRQEMIGKNPRELLKSGDHSAAFYGSLWQTILDGHVWRGEMTNRRKDGTKYLEEMTITPVRDSNGKISHFIAVKDDVSLRRNLEEQLAQARKMESVGRLAGGIAHDFNNLLTVINGYAELVLADLPDDSPSREALEEVQRAGLRASDLTRQLLTFSRRHPQRPVVFDPNVVLADMDRMLRRLIGEDVTLNIESAPVAGRVCADPAQLEQVVMNLVVNARDAMPCGGTITVGCADVCFAEEQTVGYTVVPPGSYVLLAVSDTGVGMTEEVKSRLFEPFFTTKEVGAGTGLGLATVYGIVKDSKGHIAVSSALGEGTTFTVLLPAVPPDAS